MKVLVILVLLALTASFAVAKQKWIVKEYSMNNCTGCVTERTVKLPHRIHGRLFDKAEKSTCCESGVDMCSSKKKDKFHHHPMECYCHCRCYQEDKCINFEGISYSLVRAPSNYSNYSHPFNHSHPDTTTSPATTAASSTTTTASGTTTPASATTTTASATTTTASATTTTASATTTTASATTTTAASTAAFSTTTKQASTTTAPANTVTFCFIGGTSNCSVPPGYPIVYKQPIPDGVCYSVNTSLFNGAVLATTSADCKTVEFKIWNTSATCAGSADIVLPSVGVGGSCGASLSSYLGSSVSLKIDAISKTCGQTTSEISGQTQQTSTITSSLATDVASSGLPWWLILVIAAGAVAVLGAIAWILRRKSKKPAPAPAKVTPDAADVAVGIAPKPVRLNVPRPPSFVSRMAP